MAAQVPFLYLREHWVKLWLGMRHLKYSLCWLLPVSESLGDTTLMGVQR